MAGEARQKLGGRKKLLLRVTEFLVLAVPLGIVLARENQGQTSASQNETSSAAGSVQASNEKFEVASIKPDHSGVRVRRFMLEPGRFTANNIPIRMVIKPAYNVQSNDQLTGEPE